jgi:hypothetical protein
MARKIETACMVLVGAFCALGFCWSLWELAMTTSQDNLWAMAKFYFGDAGVFALIGAPLLAYAIWDHRRR